MSGLFVIYRKELTDHFSSYRFVILFALIAMVSFITSYMAAVSIRETLEGIAKPKFVFLLLFNTSGAVFSMVRFVAFFGQPHGDSRTCSGFTDSAFSGCNDDDSSQMYALQRHKRDEL